MNLELPDMTLLAEIGCVKYRPLAPVRRYRPHRLTSTEYTRLHRQKLYAQGLTARGTPRKRMSLLTSAATR